MLAHCSNATVSALVLDMDFIPSVMELVMGFLLELVESLMTDASFERAT